MTQLTAKECMICGVAIGLCNLKSGLTGEKYWVKATQDEMQELLRKLEAIQTENMRVVWKQVCSEQDTK
jgi:hypothetical protein